MLLLILEAVKERRCLGGRGKPEKALSELDKSTGNVFGARQSGVYILMLLCTGCKTLGELIVTEAPNGDCESANITGVLWA